MESNLLGLAIGFLAFIYARVQILCHLLIEFEYIL